MNHETKNDCRRTLPMLDDLVDGQLTAAEQQRVEAHLKDCEACGEQRLSLERLLLRVDALPRSVAPEADLWPGIEPRLTERRFADRRPVVAAGRWYVLRQAVAAVVFMALGGVLSQLLLSERPEEAPVPVARGEETPRADFALAEAGLCLAEADLLRAKESLWSAVYTSHDAASPETREVVERNLAVIAGAIHELRAALDADPGNQQLEGLLLAQHRSEIGLLQRLARARSPHARSVATEI